MAGVEGVAGGGGTALSPRPPVTPGGNRRIPPVQASDPQTASPLAARGPVAPSGASPRAGPPGSEVLEGVRRREPTALAAFYDHYFGRVWSVVLRFLVDRALAEECVQEVFLRVWRAADRLDVARDPGPWLFTIAYNACRDVWRSSAHRVRRASRPILHADEASFVAPGDPEADLLRRERERRVGEALLRLPEPVRLIVLLHDFEGLDHSEIAGIVGLQPAAVRKRYSRALGVLRRELGEES